MKKTLTIAAALAVALLSVPAYAGITERNIDPATLRNLSGGLAVRNETGGTLAQNTLVYVSGWDADYSRVLVSKADADVSGAHAQLIVRAASGIANNSNGEAWPTATIYSQNTNGATVGDPVYLSTTAGGLTLSAPSGTDDVVQIVGRVRVVSATVGVTEINLRDSILVKFGTNEFQSGVALDAGLAVRNETGGNIVEGDLVYLSSWSEAETRFLIAKADADVAGAAAQFVAQGTIANNANGTVYRTHRFTADTSTSSAAGAAVYLSTTAGGVVYTAPTGNDDIVQVVGRVAVDDASGAIEFNLTGLPLVSIGTNEITDGAIANADVAAAAAIARSKLAEDALVLVGTAISNGALTTATGIPLTATVADDGLWARVYATNVVTYNSDTADNTTDASIFHFVFRLPENYVAAGDVSIRFPVALIESGAAATDNGSSIDLSCYEQAAGAVGADLVSTAAQTFAATDTWYNKDFVLTATDLVAGDQINCVVTGTVIENNAGAETITMKAGLPVLLADVKG